MRDTASVKTVSYTYLDVYKRQTILDPGVEMLEEKSGIPVVGVTPYLDIQVEDEDSLTERFDKNQEIGVIDIAVVRLPRISH